MDQWPLLDSLRNVPTLHEEVPPSLIKTNLTTFNADALLLKALPLFGNLEGLWEYCY